MSSSHFDWDKLPERYRVILCDVWGVIHDGVQLHASAAHRLKSWRDDGRFVVLITNAPRPAAAVQAQLDRLRLPRDCWDCIVTSGEAGIEAINALERPVGFVGTRDDRSVLEARYVRISDTDDFADLACTGLRDDQPEPDSYREEFARCVERRVRFHCLNPDRRVLRGGVPEACAGALADLYEELGGSVIWYGKPHKPIFRHALQLAGDPPCEAVLAVGDGPGTDMLGAAHMGFDAVFVTADRSAAPKFGDWRPLAVVEGLS